MNIVSGENKVTTRPALERISPQVGSSIMYKKFTNEKPNGPATWHYHPEIELVYVEKGSGKRHVGNNMSYYNRGELVLIGPNLPHYGFTNRLSQNNKEIVLQFMPGIFGNPLLSTPEMSAINGLLERSTQGLSFSGKTKSKAGVLLGKMALQNHFERMLGLLKVLQMLATSEEYIYLNASEVTLEADPKSNERIRKVYAHVRKNFNKSIPLEDVAELVNMTVPSFCRFFKKLTGKTFTQFVNEFRIIHACKLLSETPNTIADIAFESGYNNFSHFNKHFKLYTGKNPSVYRDEFKKMVN